MAYKDVERWVFFEEIYIETEAIIAGFVVDHGHGVTHMVWGGDFDTAPRCMKAIYHRKSLLSSLFFDKISR